MISASALRRAIATAGIVAALIAITGYLISASQAYSRVMAVRSVALLGGWQYDRVSTVPAVRLDERALREAILSHPLDARMVNIAMFRAFVHGGDAVLPKWLPIVSRLGWRDTPSLQNRLFASAMNSDMGSILDISDALMRRQQLQDQVIPMLAMVEGVPSMRASFVRRLLDNSAWRERYLLTTGSLKTQPQLQARYQLLRDLAASGVRPGRDAMLSNVATMVAGGEPQLGFALWTMLEPGVERPLHDTRFALAGARYSADQTPVPFEWQVEIGQGYGAGPYVEDGRSALDIRWNGRGVPVFARQRTSALPGRYQLDISVAEQKVRDLSALRFRLVCGQAAYGFRPIPGRPRRFVTDEAVRCIFPEFQIAGDIAAQGTPIQIEIRALRLTLIRSADSEAP
jgi:hypothetical protein